LRWLLDTCVISELVSKQPNENVVHWIDSTDAECLYLSVISLGEIRKGIEKLANSQRRQDLHHWLSEDLPIMFSNRIIALDANILIEWGALTGRMEKQGRKMPAIDSLLAATALHGNFTLVTRDVNDFKYADIKTFNPWVVSDG
jgi:predicted nucleic acid-binding protein